MGLPESAFPQVAIAVQGTALVMLFGWQIVSKKLDKKIVYFLGSAIWIIAQIGLFLIQPGQTALLYFLAILAGFGVSVAYLIPWSMIPDVIDLDELNTGKRREGIFLWLHGIVTKIWISLGLIPRGYRPRRIRICAHHPGGSNSHPTLFGSSCHPSSGFRVTRYRISYRGNSCLFLSHYQRISQSNKTKVRSKKLIIIYFR